MLTLVPWHWKARRERSGEIVGVIYGGDLRRTEIAVTTPDRAMQIVKAVNSYDDLLATVKRLFQILDQKEISKTIPITMSEARTTIIRAENGKL